MERAGGSHECVCFPCGLVKRLCCGGKAWRCLLIRCGPDPHEGRWRTADKMAYVDYSSEYSNCTNFIHPPKSILDSIHSSRNCTWLESIITGNYTTQDVWRDLLPPTIYNPNFAYCYGEQYMKYFNPRKTHDAKYSHSRSGLVPRGFGPLAESCYTSRCQWSGAGNPDIAGIGVSSFLRGNVLPPPKIISKR